MVGIVPIEKIWFYLYLCKFCKFNFIIKNYLVLNLICAKKSFGIM
jgi:hypothetical protein